MNLGNHLRRKAFARDSEAHVIYLLTYLPTYLSIYLPIYLPMYVTKYKWIPDNLPYHYLRYFETLKMIKFVTLILQFIGDDNQIVNLLPKQN